VRIGLDFDNTIVCYDQAITQLAEELFELPQQVPRTKQGLRDHLRENGREPEWTAFQGVLYGPGMRYAKPFEGAIATMQHMATEGHELLIISHRSRWPYAGTPYDLHAAARAWVADQLQCSGLFLENKSVNFLETREQKISCIKDYRCHAFVDDLAEILEDGRFPESTIRILFDPSGSLVNIAGQLTISGWAKLPSLLNHPC